jgi:hypothetical protein
MTKLTRCFSFLFGVSLLVLSSLNGFAKTSTCRDIGGMILTDVGGFGEIDGNLTTLGVATGDLKGALGVQILSASPDFTSITVQHHWVTEDGEILTIDPATLHGTFVAPGLLAVTDYKVHFRGGTGRFANAKGDTTAIGELDLNTGHAVLRYSGKLCFAGN